MGSGGRRRDGGEEEEEDGGEENAEEEEMESLLAEEVAEGEPWLLRLGGIGVVDRLGLVPSENQSRSHFNSQ